MAEKFPRIGVAVIIKKDNKVLLGKRIGSHGSGTWAFPGGHLEFNEKIFTCAKREVKEEIGIEIKNLKIGQITEDFFKKEDKHYITFFVVAEYSRGTVKILEPQKCLGWEWFDWNRLPKPLFVPINNLKHTNFNPFKK